MKKLKTILSLMIITLMMSKLAFSAELVTTNFSDLEENYWAYESIDKTKKAGFINGYPDGTFKPDGNITRAEFVKIANQIFSYIDKQDTTNFTDVKQDDWFYEEVLKAQKAGYINGYPDGTFKPNAPITRQELCKILDTINNFIELPYSKSIGDEVSPWAIEHVNKILSNRIMILDVSNNFRATQNATRAEACDALAKFILEQTTPSIPAIPSTDTGGTTGGTNTGSDTTEDLELQEIYTTIDKVILILNKNVVVSLEGTQKDIVLDIINNMKLYRNDSSHDYITAAENTREVYDTLSATEKQSLKKLIQLKVPTSDLLDLQEFFFPDMEI